MRQLFGQLPKKILIALAGIVIVTAAGAAVAHAGFGPDRPTKQYSPGVIGFDHPTFDSFTGVPNYGDERNFFTGQYPGGTTWTDPLDQVQDGDVLTLQVLVHNGADPSLGDAGIAKDTKVRVSLPSGISKSQEATAFIDSSNANPTEVTDTLDFAATNNSPFQLDYIPGSAHIHGGFIDQNMSDNLITTGDLVGTNALDGNMKACFQEEVLVTLKVKVSVPNYRLIKEVRAQGQTAKDWVKSKDVNDGDTVQWSLKFNNVGSTRLNQVALLDQVPNDLSVVPGSVVLYNGNYPNGYTFPDSAIQSNGRQVNLDIGDYLPLSSSDQQNGLLSAQVIFSTKISLPSDACGTQTITNTAYLTPQGFGTTFDTASVVVNSNKTCQTPTPTYACTLFDVKPGDHTATIDQFQTNQTNGAVFKDVVIDWGDASTPLTTNTPTSEQPHTYGGNGPYTITATAHFTVNGQDVVANDDASKKACMKTVSFTTPTTPPSTPTQLVNTGPGSAVGIVGATVVMAAIGHSMLKRRLVR